MTGLLGQLHALVDSGASGDAVHVQNLKGAQAQGDPNLRVEFGVGAFEQDLELMIEANLPSEHAQHQRRGKVAVGGREHVDGFASE